MTPSTSRSGPIRLAPTRVRRSYRGGSRLDALEGIEDPKDADRPEDWVASTTRARNPDVEDVDEGITRTIVPPDMPSLAAVVEASAENVLGRRHVRTYGKGLGFLLKVLDAAERLQVQCHPTREFAREHFGTNSGKAEGYFILATRDEVPDPHIYLGFAEPTSPEQMKDLVNRQDIDGMLTRLNPVPVAPGDVFFVPGAVAHAIGEGVLMIEIMEPSDLVARFEYTRNGSTLPVESRFMGRDLDFALSTLNFQVTTQEQVAETWFASPALIHESDAIQYESLLDSRLTDRFSLRRLRVFGEARLAEEGFYVAYVLGGRGTLEWGGEAFELARHDRFLVPADVDQVTWRTSGTLEVLLAFPPGSST